MQKIKFSHKYWKMPIDVDKRPVKLLQVFVVGDSTLSEVFKDYDTKIRNGKNEHYKLPRGRLLVLVLWTDGWLWTTVRRWTPRKESYYEGLVGQELQVIIEEER